MSLAVCIAHTGQQLQVDPVIFSSLEDFKKWIAKNASIPSNDQILMTARGKQVKQALLWTEQQEIFVYDKQLIQDSSNISSTAVVPQIPVPAPFSPQEPPDLLVSEKDLESWQQLFKSRLEWAVDIVKKCSSMLDAVRKHAQETDVIRRARDVAVANLGTHVAALKTKHNEAQVWADDILRDYEHSMQEWESAYSVLDSIPAKSEHLRFVFEKQPKSFLSQDESRYLAASAENQTLQSLFDFKDIKEAILVNQTAAKQFKSKLNSITKVSKDIVKGDRSLNEDIARANGSPTEILKSAEELLSDVEALVKKIASDYEHVLGLDSAQPKSVSQASKMALLHTKNYLINLTKFSIEMGSQFRAIVKLKNSLAVSSSRHLQTISTIESTLADVNSQISSFEFGEDAMASIELINLLQNAPFVYGSFLVESFRRRDWVEKLQIESSKLAEDLATLTDEESKRRRKWIRQTGELIWHDQSDQSVTGVEVNLKTDAKMWPSVYKQDIDDFLGSLKSIESMDLVYKDVSQLYKDLDRPSKQQAKRIKAFKMGSVHEASLKKSSILSRPEDEFIQEMKEERLRLEEKLRGSESRVRRLEDLLHRSSVMNRNANGNLFHPSPSPTHEPDFGPPLRPTVAPHQSSLDGNAVRPAVGSSRRISSNAGPEERALVNRVMALEAQLVAERDKNIGFQKEASARRDSEDEIKSQIQEANSTKDDLLQNMEAQQREFIEERRQLEQEIKRLKIKLEDVEDEIDRVIGSRDNERAGHAAELDRAREAANTQDTKVVQQIKTLQSDLGTANSRVEQVDEQRRRAVEENIYLAQKVATLEVQLKSNDENQSEKVIKLESTHRHLAPSQTVPSDFLSLILSIDALAEKSAIHQKSLDSALAMARADREALESTMHETQAETAAAKETLAAEEMESFTLRETLAEEKARTKAVSQELDQHRGELSMLRTKFAEGETGSEALRAQLEDQHFKADKLSEQLAVKEGQMKMYENEFQRTQMKLQALRAEHESTIDRHEIRANRAKELSQRIYAQNERLSWLLESLGFAITQLDDSMIIQRASKVNGASSNEADSPSALKRTMTASSTMRQALERSIDLNIISWMQAESAEAETEKYESFLKAVDAFDLDLFSEAITKRVKDMESMARKWQRETRAYRDRAHRSQHEANEKISYRSFKEGDLALFLPTRNQSTKAWAAFNVGAPHYFLREQESHRLQSRDWLLARIAKVDERVVDLKKSMADASQNSVDHRSVTDSSDGTSYMEDENPFDLSDGLRWYLLEAHEEKPGIPTITGLGKSKSTVGSVNIDARGSIGSKKSSSGGVASKTLSKSLDSRRSSTNSRKSGSHTTLQSAVINNAVNAEALRNSSTNGPHESQAVEAVRALDLGLGIGSGSDGSQNGPTQETNPQALSSSADKRRSVEKQNTTLWDSLWSFDVSLESGKGKGKIEHKPN